MHDPKTGAIIPNRYELTERLAAHRALLRSELERVHTLKGELERREATVAALQASVSQKEAELAATEVPIVPVPPDPRRFAAQLIASGFSQADLLSAGIPLS